MIVEGRLLLAKAGPLTLSSRLRVIHVGTVHPPSVRKVLPSAKLPQGRHVDPSRGDDERHLAATRSAMHEQMRGRISSETLKTRKVTKLA